MKKNIFIGVLCAILAFGATSCNKDEKTDFEQKTEYLTTNRGWKITTATSNPPYELEIGAPITNLFNGFISDCEVDDLLHFRTNGSQVLDPGRDRETYVNRNCQSSGEVSLGNWNLSENTRTLQFYLPYYRGYLLDATVLTLNENTLTLSVPIREDDEENPAKAIRNYTFTLTYTRN